MIIRPYPPQGGSGFPHASYRVEGPAPNADTGGTRVRVYTYDNIMSWRGKRGHRRRKYIYGPGVDEPISMIEAGGSYAGTYYYHFDALGSVVALTSGNVDHMGETVQVYEYDVYGRVGATDASHPNRLMFTGREYDQETGLYYYRARYYTPQIGRFLQTDPVGYGAGMNWYAYCGNNSTNGVDPSGLQTIYLYNEYAEGIYTFYQLTTGSNRVEWDLAGIANVLCVDPGRLEAVHFDGYGDGYVLRGGGTGAWNPAGKAGNREVITTDGPVAYTPIDTGPLSDGAPTRISSEPIGDGDSTSGAAAGYNSAGTYPFPGQNVIPSGPISPVPPRDMIYAGEYANNAAAAAARAMQQMAYGSTASRPQPPVGPWATFFSGFMTTVYNYGNWAAGLGKGAINAVDKGAGAALKILVPEPLISPLAPTQCTCGTNVRCRVHPRGPLSMREVPRFPTIDDTFPCDKCAPAAEGHPSNG